MIFQLISAKINLETGELSFSLYGCDVQINRHLFYILITEKRQKLPLPYTV